MTRHRPQLYGEILILKKHTRVVFSKNPIHREPEPSKVLLVLSVDAERLGIHVSFTLQCGPVSQPAIYAVGANDGPVTTPLLLALEIDNHLKSAAGAVQFETCVEVSRHRDLLFHVHASNHVESVAKEHFGLVWF